MHNGDELQIALRFKLAFVDAGATAPLTFDNEKMGLRLDKETRQVWINGILADPPLSLHQYRLLEALWDSGGGVVTRERIIDAWPEASGEGVSEQAIDTLVRRLLERIEEVTRSSDISSPFADMASDWKTDKISIIHSAETGLYLHIPFCERKCPYCDFNTYAGLQSIFQDTVDALCLEMKHWSAPLANRRISTIFLGGGTQCWKIHSGQLFENILFPGQRRCRNHRKQTRHGRSLSLPHCVRWCQSA